MFSGTLKSLKGVGDKTYEKINKLGLFTIQDCIYNYPRTYVDRSVVKPLSEFMDGEFGTVHGIVQSFNLAGRYGGQKGLFKVQIVDSSMKAEVVFFNARYLSDQFSVGQELYLYGQVKASGSKRAMFHPEFIDFHHKDRDLFLGIKPIYALTSGVSLNELIKIQRKALSFVTPEIPETLPSELLMKHQLISIDMALKNIHFPEDEAGLRLAQRRLAYEELFKLQLALFALKRKVGDVSGTAIEPMPVEDLLKALPFKLTESQTQVIEEVKKDLGATKSMNRLIQGDVGSGKTVVALVAMVMAAKQGYQSVLMAPTEILAEQHFKFVEQYASDYGVALLTGSTKDKEGIYVKIASGDVKLVIGTHALIQDKVVYDRLGLVVTDEQHRFGVRQRNALVQKGEMANVLIMSATPIPRTLSLILYGDVDISIIKERPKGRKTIMTHYIKPQKRGDMYGFIGKAVDEGQQAYFVCPLVEESETLNLNSVEQFYETVKKRYPRYEVGFLHGKMKAKDKEAVMRRFAKNEIQILVATTVIEVGIDVPNATMMVISDADRFGLAQLHQLRGRVGRGETQSYCFLLSDNLGKVAVERIQTMCQSDDGFEIADKDLALRGPGEILGIRQHGVPELKVANLSKNQDLLQLAQIDAKEIFNGYDEEALKAFLNRYIGEVLRGLTL
ncbi:MAG: ATP-dependent DNA helicase RecG [Clostridia bacterium]|nr:ATP-dependent DNA helicase RecG [Clostridia bacterium]